MYQNRISYYISYLLVLCTLVIVVEASNGDRTQFFHNCRANCERTNCTADGIEIQEQAIKYYAQTPLDKLFQWSCADECQYGCMWRTVDAFNDRHWKVPQFYGKWPFVRLLGLQEPASVVFSIMNFVAHVRMLRKFRREVRHDSPCYRVWHIFAFACLNGWIWSTVFHARDFPLTELLDYAFAYSIILSICYCTVYRLIYSYSVLLRGFIAILFLTFFINYFSYLSIGRFNYSLNMKVNIVTGVLSASLWMIWSVLVRKRRPYYRRVVRFYFLFGLAMGLELLDFPPIFWLLDAHALWHLATVPLVPIFYGFLIEDCRALRKEKQQSMAGFNKEI